MKKLLLIILFSLSAYSNGQADLIVIDKKNIFLELGTLASQVKQKEVLRMVGLKLIALK
jgi:hypothetical protein